MKGELANLDATEQAELLRRKEVSPLELVDAAITRIEKVNPQLNAVITPLFDKARAKAQQAGGSSLPDGPFRGVPFLLKDLVCATGGDPIYGGMRLLRDARFVAPRLKGDEVNMSSRKPDPLPAIPLAMLLLGRVEECIEQLKESADQLGQSRDNKDASRVARETIDFLKHWLTSFQITAGRPL
jgi:Amidase